MATRRSTEKTEVQKQRAMLSAAIQFEYQSGKSDPDWDLSQGGLSRITEHYCLLDEQLVLADADVFGKICEEFARFAGFVDDHLPMAQKLTKTRELLEPFWGFFLAVCRALRDGENPLTPMDAAPMNLKDEMCGGHRKKLHSEDEDIDAQPKIAPPSRPVAPPPAQPADNQSSDPNASPDHPPQPGAPAAPDTKTQGTNDVPD